MTDLVTTVNSLLTDPTPSTTTPPPSTEEDSDENDHQMQTSSSSDEHSNQGKTTTIASAKPQQQQQAEQNELFPSPAPDTETEQEKMDTSQSNNNHTLRSKFELKFKQLLEANSSSSFHYLANNVWILNQIIMLSVSSGSTSLQCGSLKIRYSHLENDTSAYQNQKRELLELPDDLESDCDFLSADINSETPIQFKNGQIIQRNHVHTLFASNFSGQHSAPLVIHSNELDANNFHLHDVSKTICLHKTSNGDLNDLGLFISWLKCFIKQQEELNNLESKSILINSYLYSLLFRSSLSTRKQELINLLRENKIYLLFYPVDAVSDAFNRHIFDQFKENWKQLVIKYASKSNPNSLLGFVNIFKQTVRETFSSTPVLRATFNDLVSNFKLLNSDLTSEMSAHLANLTNQQGINRINDETSSNSKDDDATQTSDETEPPPTSSATPTASSNTQNAPAIPKPNEQELAELTDWINEMCKIGCLCIRYTYLRDLQMRHRPKQLSTSKELLASDNKWLDLMRKTQSKLDYPNENEYVSKWYDMKQWRQAYFNFIRHELKVTEADTIWTFDLMQFPYTKGIVHAPENDYPRRPRNFKPKISVIFAFNAAGDYLAPYFVYPTHFKDEKELSQNECFSHNGYVTTRSFESWLTGSFLPYLSEKERKLTVLLYCGKLAVFDAHNLELCKRNNIKPFGVADEKIKPFTVLFQKSARKRQTDLFLDSWKKVTSKSGVAYQFKCASRQGFFHLFIDAFQNCIEESGNSSNESLTNEELSTSLNGSQSTAVKDFKNKMVSSFEQCQLWPVRDEDYKEYFEINEKINEISNSNNDTASSSTGISPLRKPSSTTSDKIDSIPVSSSEPVVKKRGRKKSFNTNEGVSTENNELNEEENNKVNGDEQPQSDLDEENESEREEPVNKRRKLSMNGKSKKLSYAEILQTDTDFRNVIELMIENKIRSTSLCSNKLTSDLIEFMFRSKILNKSLSVSDLKRRLKEKLDSCERREDFLGNFLQSILDDSDLFSSAESNGVGSSETASGNSRNDLFIHELNSLICSVYEKKN